RGGPPLPSTIVPPRMTRSCMGGPYTSLGRGGKGLRSVVAEFAGWVPAHGEGGGRARRDEIVQRPADTREGDLLPGDLVPREQRHLVALRSGGDIGHRQARTEDQLHLADARDG